jgi:integrase
MAKRGGLTFTTRWLDSLKPRASQYEIADKSTPGLSVRVSPGGSKTFFVRVGRSQTRYKLGRYSAGLSLQDARRLASDKLSQAHLTGTANDPGPTFGQIIDAYLAHADFEELADRTKVEYRRLLGTGSRNYLGPIRERRVAEVTPDEMKVFLHHDLPAMLGSPTPKGTIRHVAAVLKSTLGWAVKTGFGKISPAVTALLPSIKQEKAQHRQRWLSDAELAAVCHAVAREPIFRPVLSALLLTALRLNEVAGLRWSEVRGLDTDNPHLLIAADRMKSRREHYVPLAPAMVALLTAQPKTGELVFPGAGTADGGTRTKLSGWSYVKDRLEDRVAKEATLEAHAGWPAYRAQRGLNLGAMSGDDLDAALSALCSDKFTPRKNRTTPPIGLKAIEPWTLHDFRHTAATVMGSSLGVHDDTIEEVLAHARQGIRRVYNHSVRHRERREALEKWADYLSTIGLVVRVSEPARVAA